VAVTFRGGFVVSPEGVFRLDVRADGGVITDMGASSAKDGDEIVDVSGKYLCPGGVDAHTHFDLPLGGASSACRAADDFRSGTEAAIAGGTTCVIDYATQFRGETLRQGLDNWHALAESKCLCDYAFHLAIADWNPKTVSELPAVIADGITSFKMYMAYKGSLQVSDGVLYEALVTLKSLGGLLCVHCENGDVIASRTAELLGSGKTGPEHHPESRPEELETEAVERLLALAALSGSPVYAVHVSSSRSMEKIIEAKAAGIKVFAETCPQYLYLDKNLYATGGWEAAKYVCSPPLRAKRNWRGLWASLSGDLADVVATDHCPFSFKGQKELGRGDFSKIPNGLPGVESRMLLLYKGAADGRITLPQMTRLISANPARIFGLYPKKGIIMPGSDADIVVIDPSGQTEITARNHHGNADYTPYEGMRVPCLIESVYLRGKRLFHKGRLESGKPGGRFVPRQASGTQQNGMEGNRGCSNCA
jgi:dihydropyrimidinase